MNVRIVILAFLAERSPAAYADDVIAQRVTASGLVDAPVPPIAPELTCLASERMGRLVSCDINPVTKTAVWFATEAGIRQWVLDGRLHVS